MKIAIVVHGRFHAFDLSKALLARGHQVTIFTNYPKWACKHFGIAPANIKSFWLHGICSRLLEKLHQAFKIPYPEARLHQMFGRWAARELKKESWDIIHCWSGVSEELLTALRYNSAFKLLMRGSAHIRTQTRLLEEEEKRTGISIDKPSEWVMKREEKEYALADHTIVLSQFAYQSFISEKVQPDKIRVIPLGVSIQSFRPSPENIDRRCQRILSGIPLQILFVGTLSFQKGVWDLAEIARRLKNENFRFRFVGSTASEATELIRELRRLVEFIPREPQSTLLKHYTYGDIFIYPTIQDGFAQVLAEAQAAALPIITTTHCGSADLIQNGETGWILPIRSPEAFIHRLRWCDSHREELFQIVQKIYNKFQLRDWQEVAADFEKICGERLNYARR